MGWSPGDVIVRRELWRDRPWTGCTVRVVADEDDLLVTYLPAGTPFAFPNGDFPRHPWHGRGAWSGHGLLALHRPRDAYAVFVFWTGSERTLDCWYLNLQEQYRRTPIGFDTFDHELDVVVSPDGSWRLKDSDLLDLRVREGRFTPEQAAASRSEAARLERELELGRRWWDDAWATWRPPPDWTPTPLPEGWDEV